MSQPLSITTVQLSNLLLLTVAANCDNTNPNLQQQNNELKYTKLPALLSVELRGAAEWDIHSLWIE